MPPGNGRRFRGLLWNAFRAGALVTVLALASTAGAQAPAVALPTGCAIAPELASAEPTRLLDALRVDLLRCDGDPVWLGRAGQLLSRAGLHAQAAEYLERALLLDPSSRELSLDYALALAGSGDDVSALELLRALLAEPDMPAPLRASLLRMMHTIRSPAPKIAAGDHRLLASVRLGHDSNLLGAPNLSQLGISLGGQADLYYLPLDPSYLRQPGGYLRSELGWVYAAASGENKWQTWALLRDRHSPGVQDAGLQQLSVGAEVWRSNLYAGVGATRLRAETGIRYGVVSLGTGVGHLSSWSGYDCLLKGGVQAQSRDMRSNPVLSGRYTGLSGQWLCERSSSPRAQAESTWSGVLAAWLLELNLGQDRPVESARPGGTQGELSVRLMMRSQPHSVRLPGWAGPGHGARTVIGRWLIEIEAVRRADRDPYSVLFGDATRRLRSIAARLEWQASLSDPSGWQLQVGYQTLTQRSNIELFGVRSRGPYLALTRVW